MKTQRDGGELRGNALGARVLSVWLFGFSAFAQCVSVLETVPCKPFLTSKVSFAFSFSQLQIKREEGANTNAWAQCALLDNIEA